MNRRTRRARRRLRRGGHREPLLMIVDDGPGLGESIALIVRLGHRYRSELAPPVVAGALAVAAAILHGNHVSPWWVALVTLVVAGALCWPRITATLRPTERGYAAAMVAVSGGWLIAATAHGAGTPPLPSLLVAATLVGGVPWWAHRRRRAKVRVERTLAAWPDITAAVGLPGSRIMSAVVDHWGWHARIGLPPGKTAADLIHSAPALESGLEPDPDRADHAVIRVLTTDPHAEVIPYTTAPTASERSIHRPIPLGLFEDAQPVMLHVAHRHGLLGGVAGAGKSGVLNVILAELVACPDVVLWGIDLKGGMELQPWASCLGRLATTPEAAAALLVDAVMVLQTRARQLADHGLRLWMPTADTPALIVVIDEYAELADESPTAISHADSIARRGRAVAVTLLAATQRPTQKAMGSGAVRSQIDVRVCLRVRERRDVDLILGQGMLAAGWAADTLNAPGKFLVSTPEHTTPRRARAYRLDDDTVAAIAARHAAQRPELDELSQGAAGDSSPGAAAGDAAEPTADGVEGDNRDPECVLWDALQSAPAQGRSVNELMTATDMGRTWIYARLQAHAAAGRVTQVTRGRWVATPRHRTSFGPMSTSSARTSAVPKRPYAQARASRGRPCGRVTQRPAPVGGRATEDLDEHVRRIVDGAPALTGMQRARLAALLRPMARRATGPRSPPSVAGPVRRCATRSRRSTDRTCVSRAARRSAARRRGRRARTGGSSAGRRRTRRRGPSRAGSPPHPHRSSAAPTWTRLPPTRPGSSPWRS